MNDPIETFFSAVSSGDLNRVTASTNYEHFNVNVERYGQTALHETLSEEIAGFLISKDANVNQPNVIGRTPLHKASGVGCIGVVNILISHGASVNKSDVYGWTPLHLASNQGQVGVIHVLLEKNADVNAVDESGQTPLHMRFCREGDVVTDILIKKKADVNTTDNYGMTPLHVAAGLENSVEVIKVLLKNNADENVADNYENTPLDLASSHGKELNKYILIHNPYRIMYKHKRSETGLVLIVNYTERRPGSGEDVKKIEDFFNDTLGYHVQVGLNKDKTELFKLFESIKNKEMKRKPAAYHCFVLVMMCHGNQDKFQIRDGYVKVRDIVDQFKHEDFPGHVAYRNPLSEHKPWIGAYFVHALLDVFTKNYKTQHVVEMLQVVRRNLNMQPEFKEEGVTCQMSEDLSTLDCPFYL